MDDLIAVKTSVAEPGPFLLSASSGPIHYTVYSIRMLTINLEAFYKVKHYYLVWIKGCCWLQGLLDIFHT